MAKYFDLFPRTRYDLNKDGSTTKVTDVLIRFKFLDTVLKNRIILLDYIVRDEERPDIVADRVYKDQDLGWIILLTNMVFDPYYQWPMDSHTFRAHLKHKYGTIRASTQTPHSYYRIIQPESRLYDGTIIHERTLRIDHTSYLLLSDDERKMLSCYEWEVNLNEEHRQIKLIDPVHISRILTEAKEIFS